MGAISPLIKLKWWYSAKNKPSALYSSFEGHRKLPVVEMDDTQETAVSESLCKAIAPTLFLIA
jgi:hypothetical protein